MPRYIDAEVLKSRLEDFSRWCKDGRKEGVDFVLDCPLPDIPTADVQEVRHGKWLPNMEWFDDDYGIEPHEERYQTSWKCSLCGRIELIKEPYCHCGAKMDGKEAEAKMKGGVEE